MTTSLKYTTWRLPDDNPGAGTLPFGKHRGKKLAKLPADYLKWLNDVPDLREPLAAAVRQELLNREVSKIRRRREREDCCAS